MEKKRGGGNREEKGLQGEQREESERDGRKGGHGFCVTLKEKTQPSQPRCSSFLRAFIYLLSHLILLCVCRIIQIYFPRALEDEMTTCPTRFPLTGTVAKLVHAGYWVTWMVHHMMQNACEDAMTLHDVLQEVRGWVQRRCIMRQASN